LTQWKHTPGHEWLADAPATCLTQCLRDQDKALTNFFEKRARYPRFKRRGSDASLRFQDIGKGWECGALSLPKLGKVKLAEELPRRSQQPDAPFVARPDMVTLTRDAAGRFYVSFCTQVEPLAATGRIVAVDLGVAHLATLSTGEKIEAPKHYHARLRYLRQQQATCAWARATRCLCFSRRLLPLGLRASARARPGWRGAQGACYQKLSHPGLSQCRSAAAAQPLVRRGSLAVEHGAGYPLGRFAGRSKIGTSTPLPICWRRVFASLPGVTPGTCALMREVQAREQSRRRCPQMKRDAGH
jgi:hypothetical protein